jgi:hypothetical protein
MTLTAALALPRTDDLLFVALALLHLEAPLLR